VYPENAVPSGIRRAKRINVGSGSFSTRRECPVPCPATTQVVKLRKCAEIGGQAVKKALFLHTCRCAVPQQKRTRLLPSGRSLAPRRGCGEKRVGPYLLSS
jgi:hypothetical protein